VGSVNKAIILGFCGKDPEIKSFPSGGKIATFSVATSESWRDKASGERKEKTQWHNIVVKNEALVRLCQNSVRKGSRLMVEGSIETRKWQAQDGQDRYATEIVVGPFRGEITLLDSPNSGDREAAPREREAPAKSKPARSFADDLDDSIPFD
jgi:single-strand DNA-binding protein